MNYIVDDLELYIQELNQQFLNEIFKNYLGCFKVTNQTQIIESLYQSLQKGKLTLITGAALSKAPPSYCPSWMNFRDEIIDSLIDFLNKNGISNHKLLDRSRESLKESSIPPEIFFEGIDRFGGLSYVKIFVDLLNAGKPNRAHRLIAALLNENYLKHVITTNWDTYIEQSLEKNLDLKIINDEEDINPNISSSKYFLHIHGSIVSPRGAVLGGLYRIGFSLSSKIKNLFQKIIGESDCLVLGYSGNDWDIHDAFIDAMQLHNQTKIYWLYLKEYGLSENVKKLIRDYPEKIIPFESELESLLIHLCDKVKIKNCNISPFPEPNRKAMLEMNFKYLGVYSSCLVLAFANASYNKWRDAREYSLIASDITSSFSNYIENRHRLACEPLRYASACAIYSAKNEAEEFLHECELEFNQIENKTMVEQSHYMILLSYQRGIIELSLNQIEKGYDTLWKAISTVRLEKTLKGFGIVSDQFPMLNLTVALGFAIASAMFSENLPETLAINKEVYFSMNKQRNLWGYCCCLLSLSLCFYRMNLMDDSKSALQDCIEASERYGVIPCAIAAKNNIILLEGKEISTDKPNNSFLDPRTKWQLIIDPFSVYIEFVEEKELRGFAAWGEKT